MHSFAPADILNLTVFVLDDNPINLLLMTKLLSKAGYTNVITSSAPERAEQDVLAIVPDLVILDLNMPVVDGYEVLGRLRKNKGILGFLPVLVFTADASGAARSRALELGASDFLTKPGDPDEIRLRVRNFLTMRYYYRRLENQNAALEDRVQERTKSLYEAQLEVVYRLALAGDYRDDDTGEHCRRVGDVSGQIALAYGCEPKLAELIRLAAPLHDIGKVGVSDLILNKPGRLSDEEMAVMRRHTELGAAILRNSKSEILQMAHTIALTHHERWDGTGYCANLSGADIPLEGRIVAVADVFDALTHDRPYKTAWSVEEACAEIVRAGGTQFDPKVVDAFLTVMNEKPDVSQAA
ncbi:MAG: HD domain-containing phosphohydrolase [Fimbriimonadaceae bacterium]